MSLHRSPDFELSDLVVENGTMRPALTGSDNEYEVYGLEFADEFQGELTITVPFGVAEDADGRVNNAGSCTADHRPAAAAGGDRGAGGRRPGARSVRGADRVR